MVKFLKSDQSSSQNLASGELDYTTTYTKPFKLQLITIKASVNITEDITITLDSAEGATYDVVLRKKSLSAEQHFVYKPDGEPSFLAGDNIRIQCTNANLVGIVYLLVKAGELN